MLVLVDLECKKCLECEEVLASLEETFPRCPKCSGSRRRVFTKVSFKLNFNPKTDMCGWGYDGYAHNQHWDQIKKIKEETGKTPLSYSDLDTKK